MTTTSNDVTADETPPAYVADTSTLPLGRLESELRAKREAGRKLLLPYITAGYPADDWGRLVEGLAAAGADAIEIGVPFSDPVMDGTTIQESSTQALADGIDPGSAFDTVAGLDVGIPLIAMTYYNICFRMGHRRFAQALVDAGISAAILPDLPLEEAEPWARAADHIGVETVLLAAPTAPDDRLPRITARSRGFVYGVGLVGVTGEREALAASSLKMAERLKQVTDKPVLIGVGVSSPEQAAEVCQVADGVVVGSAVIRRVIDDGVDAAIDFVAALRAGLDGAS